MIVGGGTTQTNINNNTFFGMFVSDDNESTTETDVQTAMPIGGTLSRLYFRRNSTAAATVTVRKNGANTALTCTTNGTLNNCTDLVNSVSYAAGDLISFLITTGGSGSPSRVTLQFQSP
jgi:hypothetical protein